MTPDSAISLYIHFPFCVHKCRYCDFYSLPYDRNLADAYIGALRCEWDMVCAENNLGNPAIRTIFCGGGTPSILSPVQWHRFCEVLMRRLSLQPDTEWTVECNPESFTAEKAGAWLDSGVTRLSIGVQSLDDRLLKLLGRCHSSRDALNVLSNAALGRFASASVDIMYGIPGQTMHSLKQTLDKILSFAPVAHLSAYELTLADHTPFGRHKRLLPLVDENLLADMLELIQSRAACCGMERYEVSNWARPGHECRHNIAYWNNSAYIGLGAAAHSYLPPIRYANCADVRSYIEKLSHARPVAGFRENLSLQQRLSEMIMLALRTAQGLDENKFARESGEEFCAQSRRVSLHKLVSDGFLIYDKPFWRPTPSGLMRADALAAMLA